MNIEELKIINDMERGWIRGEGQPLWHEKVYHMWKGLWDRCRNPNNHAYKYYKDCKIYDEFRFLSKFVDWLMNEPRFEEFAQTCDKIRWNIDKDMKDPNNRNYYPEYMILTTQIENSKERIQRRGHLNPPKIPVIAIDKNNKVLLFDSINVVKNKMFLPGEVSNCINKKHKTHKGYRWYKINYKHNLRLRKK